MAAEVACTWVVHAPGPAWSGLRRLENPEIKDFIAPIPVSISNCGTVNIIKHTDPRGVNQDFSYTSTIPNPPAGQPAPTTPDCTLDTTPSSFTLNDHAGVDPAAPITQGTDNTEHCANVPVGSYTVTEGTEPGSFVLESLTCTATGTGSSGSQHSPAGMPKGLVAFPVDPKRIVLLISGAPFYSL